MHTIHQYQQFISEYFQSQKKDRNPKNLYEPIEYIISIGGKRIRPTLTLMTTEIFDVNYQKALPAALAVEVFHNFSLVHDDIMDDAPLRRGHETVHEKWDVNTAILSGDAMLILAYQYFENYEPTIFRDLARLFSKTAIEVCEGQQLDVDFESRDNVTIDEYLKMIEYKTAVLVAAAMQMGAIVAQASEDNARKIYDFGLNLGIAFQIQDDYLDAFGDPATFGKQVGGDIIENKKTYLYIKTNEFASAVQKTELEHLYSIQPENNDDKIIAVKNLYDSTGASSSTKEAILFYTNKAFEILETIEISQDKKDILLTFGKNLMDRKV